MTDKSSLAYEIIDEIMCSLSSSTAISSRGPVTESQKYMSYVYHRLDEVKRVLASDAGPSWVALNVAKANARSALVAASWLSNAIDRMIENGSQGNLCDLQHFSDMVKRDLKQACNAGSGLPPAAT